MKKCAVGVKIVNRTLFYVLSFLTAIASHIKNNVASLILLTLPIRFFHYMLSSKGVIKCKNFIAVNYKQ